MNPIDMRGKEKRKRDERERRRVIKNRIETLMIVVIQKIDNGEEKENVEAKIKRDLEENTKIREEMKAKQKTSIDFH